MCKSSIFFLLFCCSVFRGTFGDASVNQSGSPINVTTRAPTMIPITAPSAVPSIVFPFTAPFRPRTALSSQPSAFPTGIPSATLKIPSSVPYFGSTAQPTVNRFMPTVAPGTARQGSSDYPSSSPESPTLSPDCFTASVVRASQVDKTHPFPPP